MENVIVTDLFNQLDSYFAWVALDDRKELEEFYGNYLPMEAWALLSLKDKSMGTEGNWNKLTILSVNDILFRATNGTIG